jgi:hypothetical protein
MWEPRHLTPLWAFTACYSDGFTSKFLLFTSYYYEDQRKRDEVGTKQYVEDMISVYKILAG